MSDKSSSKNLEKLPTNINKSIDILDSNSPISSLLTNIKKPLSKNKQKELLKQSQHNEAVLHSFSEFYSQQYGEERWKSLFQALSKPIKHVAMINNFANLKNVDMILDPTIQNTFSNFENEKNIERENYLEKVKFLDLPCYSSSKRFLSPFRDENGIMVHYLLDATSIMAVKALQVKPTDNILDLCAAPGGKSLVILQYLLLNSKKDERNFGGGDIFSSGFLTSNDISDFSKWKVSKSKINSKRQYMILLDAVKGLHVGGILVYVTCSINKFENDEVVKNILKNSWVPLEEIGENYKWEIGERTEKGWIILPDKCDGWGPLYFAILKRVGDGNFRKKGFKKIDRNSRFEKEKGLYIDDEYNEDELD
ncbi:6100_t:CDS:2 [Diversispora eburnea]|uniref:6100_t:CDS:1 n=1 Tax=Diversispora eburnea TaxID=1213867 RepID=A0A9N8V5E7_9GLOM|nr:6100_t:CDS:2 [Diversispora eburnea]